MHLYANPEKFIHVIDLGNAHSQRESSGKASPSLAGLWVQWVLVLLHRLLVGPEIFIKNQLLPDVFTYKCAALLFKKSYLFTITFMYHFFS